MTAPGRTVVRAERTDDPQLSEDELRPVVEHLLARPTGVGAFLDRETDTVVVLPGVGDHEIGRLVQRATMNHDIVAELSDSERNYFADNATFTVAGRQVLLAEREPTDIPAEVVDAASPRAPAWGRPRLRSLWKGFTFEGPEIIVAGVSVQLQSDFPGEEALLAGESAAATTCVRVSCDELKDPHGALTAAEARRLASTLVEAADRLDGVQS